MAALPIDPLPSLTRAWRAFLLIAWALLAGAAMATEPGASPHAELRIHNQPEFQFRVSLMGYTPAERAAAARVRFRNLLDAQGPGVVGVRPVPDGRAIEIDGKMVFMVMAGDVAGLEGRNLDDTAAAAQARLQETVKAVRESRDPVNLMHALARAIAGTAVWLLLVRLLALANRRAGVWFAALVARQTDRLTVAGVKAIPVGSLAVQARPVVSVAAWCAGLFLTYLWLVFVLSQFAYTRPWGEQLRDFLLDVLRDVGLAIAGAIPGLVLVIVILLLTRLVSSLAGGFFRRAEQGEVAVGWLDSDTAGPTRRLVNVGLWLFALAMAYPYLPGAGTEAFKGVSVLVGLMVSIGASGIVGQAASGLIIMYTRTVRPGEFVRIADAEGTVTELGLFSTRIRTGLGEEVVLPNSLVVGNVTRNLSRVVGGQGFMIHTVVTIGYDTPWRQVHALLVEAARTTRGVLDDPAPFVVQTALSDFYVEYRLVACAGPEAPRRRAEAISLLHSRILDLFNEHGVQIMSPHYMQDPAEPKIVAPGRWEQPPAGQDR